LRSGQPTANESASLDATSSCRHSHDGTGTHFALTLCGGRHIVASDVNAEREMSKPRLLLILIAASGASFLWMMHSETDRPTEGVARPRSAAAVTQRAATQSEPASRPQPLSTGPLTTGSERLESPQDSTKTASERVEDLAPVTPSSLPERQHVSPPAEPLPPNAERPESGLEPHPIQGIERVNP